VKGEVKEGRGKRGGEGGRKKRGGERSELGGGVRGGV